MIELHHLLIPVSALVVGVAGGVAFAGWRDVRSRGAEAAVLRGRGLTVPVLVSVAGDNRRAYGVVDGRSLRVIGPRTHLVLDGATYVAEGHREHRLEPGLLEFSRQRGYVDAAGTRYLVGAFDDWEDALTAALTHGTRPAGRLRLWAAATPRGLAAAFAAAALALLVFQGIWAAGHDATATMLRVVGDEGLESCAVQWEDGDRSEYAEVDCYEPFPTAGSPVVVRALAWPFDESAMDEEGSYEGLTVVLGGLTVVLGAITAGVVLTRVRRQPIRLAPVPGPVVHVSEPTPVHLDAGDPLPALLGALSAVEAWEDGVGPAPEQRRYEAVELALYESRWWPVAVLAAPAFLVDGLPDPVRVVLVVAAVAALLWAVYGSVSTWLAVSPAYRGPVTSEWEYRLVRVETDEWAALLFLGDHPHWLVWLVTDGAHPAPIGWCGVRGDLEEGGAVQLSIGGDFWMASGPVWRVDDDLLGQIREDVLERLADRGRPGALGDGPPE